MFRIPRLALLALPLALVGCDSLDDDPTEPAPGGGDVTRPENAEAPRLTDIPRPVVGDWLRPVSAPLRVNNLGRLVGLPLPEQDVRIDACDPPLSIDPPNATVLPYDLVTLRPLGGTGQYSFRLASTESGALLNEVTGAYLAGAEGGFVDTVVLEDAGCRGQAEGSVRVVEGMRVRPLDAELRPGTTMVFDTERGSGVFSYSLVRDETGATLSVDGEYIAGDSEGTDRIRVIDRATGEEVDALVTVRGAAGITPRPARVRLPVGARYLLQIDGGSGHFVIEGADALLGFEETDEGGWLVGQAPGSASLSVTDAFTGERTTVQIEVAGSLQAPMARAGDLFSHAVVRGAGDIDGDGFGDAVLAQPEADINAFNSGGVFIYAGGPEGLGSEPVRIIGGETNQEELGRSLVVEDLDGDGLLDLAVGAIRADFGANDTGGVFIYKGVPGQFFSEAPVRTLGGERGGDHMGFAMTACDFNGDGRNDLAVGVWLDENNEADVVRANQGAAWIYLGYPDGFLDQPDQIVYGQSLDAGGAWIDDADLRLGLALASADVDGDGNCELVAGSNRWASAANRTTDGAVYVYKGVPAAEGTAGGLSEAPVVSWVGDGPNDPNSQLGRFVAAGDIDGDGRAEVIMAQYQHEEEIGRNDNYGALRVMRGGPLSDVVATQNRSVEAVDWTYAGDQRGDQAGWYARVGDVDGDGINELISGDFRGEAEGGPNDTGALAIFKGRRGELPETTPWQVIGGVAREDRFGAFFDIVGDVDGDRRADLLVLATQADDYGIEIGVPYFVPGDGMNPRALALPGEASGAQYGRGAAVVGDVNGDGIEDVVVGAPLADSPTFGVNSGGAWLYLGTATGAETEPALALLGFRRHSGSDFVGYQVAPAGDFDGDGVADIAVLARFEDRPGSFDATWAPEAECVGASNNPGAVLIFRGSANGLPDVEPDFVIFGPQVGQGMEYLAGGFDYDGDGLGDVMAGGPAWDCPGLPNCGGAAVWRGRPADPAGRPVVICAPTFQTLGPHRDANAGRSVAGLGDIDGDGCDEVIVGTNRESVVDRNRGSATVHFGQGAGCAAGPRAVRIEGPRRDAQSGWAVAGGGDVDGDGLPDMAVGAIRHVADGNVTGGAWLVPGAYLAGLPTDMPVDGAPLPRGWPIVDPARSGSYVTLGRTADEYYGNAVAFAPDPENPGRSLFVVSGPRGELPGVTEAGGVYVYRFSSAGGLADPEGFYADPIVTFGGETTVTGGRVGEWLLGGSIAGRSVVVVGGFFGEGAGLDQGSAYVMALQD